MRHLAVFFTAVYVLSLIPMLALSFYDFPSADDFSMALQPHLYFVETGNFFGTVIESLKKSWIVYSQYEGYFFSIILTCICPGVFGEGWYFLTPFIILGMLTFGVFYFFDALFVRMWKLDRDMSVTACMVTLILMVQCLPQGVMRAEAFYWYSGAINYTFTFGMAFFWLGLLIRSVYDEDAKARKRKVLWASFWGFWMGGANYMTALELAICSVLILFIFIMIKRGVFKFVVAGTEAPDSAREKERYESKRKSFGLIWIPAVTNLVGFACSCLTPGNLVRSAETGHIGPVKSILLSIHSTFDMMTNDMLRWETLVALVLLAAVFWKMSESLKVRLQHPFMFALFAFLLVSSNVVPPFFAVANIGAGRLRALAWMEYVLMLVLVVFYLTAWARQRLEDVYLRAEAKRTQAVRMDDVAGTEELKNHDTAMLNKNIAGYGIGTSMVIAVCIAFIFFGSAIMTIPNMRYYCATSALSDLLDGSAATYKAENAERLRILNDDSVKDAALMEYSVHPELLFYEDVTPDKDEWINGATAKYYFKDSVVLKSR